MLRQPVEGLQGNVSAVTINDYATVRKTSRTKTICHDSALLSSRPSVTSSSELDLQILNTNLHAPT